MKTLEQIFAEMDQTISNLDKVNSDLQKVKESQQGVDSLIEECNLYIVNSLLK